MKDCHDCGAKPGELHAFGCDMEACHVCGMQAISCEHRGIWREDYRRVPWDGEGVLRRAARRFDLWCVVGAWREWVPCAPGTPGARLDLNRVPEECYWSRVRQEWVKR